LGFVTCGWTEAMSVEGASAFRFKQALYGGMEAPLRVGLLSRSEALAVQLQHCRRDGERFLIWMGGRARSRGAQRGHLGTDVHPPETR